MPGEWSGQPVAPPARAVRCRRESRGTPAGKEKRRRGVLYMQLPQGSTRQAQTGDAWSLCVRHASVSFVSRKEAVLTLTMAGMLS
jgi:hypothetical protein